jgi:hypothetical protein
MKNLVEYKGEDLETNDREEAINKADKMDDSRPNFDDLEWVPEETEDEFVAEMMDDKEGDLEDNIRDTIKTYKDTNLVHTAHMAVPVEVMFRCKAYYLVNNDYDGILYEALIKGRKFSNLMTGWDAIHNPDARKHVSDPHFMLSDPF